MNTNGTQLTQDEVAQANRDAWDQEVAEKLAKLNGSWDSLEAAAARFRARKEAELALVVSLVNAVCPERRMK